MRIVFRTFFIALLLMGCNSVPESTQLPTLESPTVVPSTVPELTAPSVTATSTEWLPYDPNIDTQGCGEFTATLPANGTEHLSDLEITHRLFEIYLGHYRSPELGGLCRLKDFKVEYVEDRFADLASEQNVDFVNTVKYSVQVSEAPTDWVAGNGELSAGGWILHKVLIVGVTKENDEYVLKLIGTGP